MNNYDTSREWVQKLNRYIRIVSGREQSYDKDELELLERDLADFLTLVDKRQGIFVKGPND